MDSRYSGTQCNPGRRPSMFLPMALQCWLAVNLCVSAYESRSIFQQRSLEGHNTSTRFHNLNSYSQDDNTLFKTSKPDHARKADTVPETVGPRESGNGGRLDDSRQGREPTLHLNNSLSSFPTSRKNKPGKPPLIPLTHMHRLDGRPGMYGHPVTLTRMMVRGSSARHPSGYIRFVPGYMTVAGGRRGRTNLVHPPYSGRASRQRPSTNEKHKESYVFGRLRYVPVAGGLSYPVGFIPSQAVLFKNGRAVPVKHEPRKEYSRIDARIGDMNRETLSSRVHSRHHHSLHYRYRTDVPPTCAIRTNTTYCLRDDEYPDHHFADPRSDTTFFSSVALHHAVDTEDIRRFLAPTAYSMQYQKQYGHQLPGGRSVCSATVHWARPLRARSVNGHWKVVLNINDPHRTTHKLHQVVVTEVCLNPGEPCSWRRSRCVQKYGSHKLVVWSREDGVHVDDFRFPVACSCFLQEGYRQNHSRSLSNHL
ncbi:neurotrophin 1-like [Ornithodoros turicata]|uniref:neurotrophin 1-like n=1 Tax=Ornithodoros turicata TaxID=34597 RepID=UPI003138B8A6